MATLTDTPVTTTPVTTPTLTPLTTVTLTPTLNNNLVLVESKSIIQLLLSNLTSPNIKLSQSEILYMKNILQSDPKIVQQIQDDINNICVDGVINYSDIPDIIILIADIYRDHMIINLVNDVGICNIVKFTIDSILDSGLLPFPETELKIAKNILDPAIMLLGKNITITPIKNSKLCSCFTF